MIRLRNELKATQNKIEKLVTEIENGTSSSTVASRLAQREDELEHIKKQLQKEAMKQKHLDPRDVRQFLRLLRRGYKDNITYQKMLIHIFVDRIYLYDDHFVIYLKGANKRITINDHEAEIVEESLTDACSNNTDYGPPGKALKTLGFKAFFILIIDTEKWRFITILSLLRSVVMAGI